MCGFWMLMIAEPIMAGALRTVLITLLRPLPVRPVVQVFKEMALHHA